MIRKTARNEIGMQRENHILLIYVAKYSPLKLITSFPVFHHDENAHGGDYTQLIQFIEASLAPTH